MSSLEDGPLPQSAKDFISQALLEEKKRALGEVPPMTHIANHVENLLDPKNDIYVNTVEIFRVFHISNPTSICKLDISDPILLDLIWTEVWNIPTLSEKIENGEISEKALLPTNRAAFSELKSAIKNWQEKQPEDF